MTGPPGTGKTCAALRMLDHSAGLYWTSAAFASEAVQAMRGELLWPWCGDRRVGEAFFWRAVAGATLVVLDDLATRRAVTDADYDRTKRLLDLREGRPLVVISNVALGQITQLYDDRIASRLTGGTVLTLSGRDRRQKAR